MSQKGQCSTCHEILGQPNISSTFRMITECAWPMALCRKEASCHALLMPVGPSLIKCQTSKDNMSRYPSGVVDHLSGLGLGACHSFINILWQKSIIPIPFIHIIPFSSLQLLLIVNFILLFICCMQMFLPDPVVQSRKH